MRCVNQAFVLIRVLPYVLVAEFILGVIGNGMALWIFLFRLKPWKSSTVLLFNLALADFLLNMALPFRASYYFSKLRWHFGHAFCNVSLFLLAANRSGSIFFLVAIAVDRYVRVAHPHHALNSLSVGKAACGAAALWLVTLSMTAHLLAHERHNGTDCDSYTADLEGHAVSWHTGVFVFSFYLALAIMVFCTCSIIARLRGRQLAQQAHIRRALFLIVVVVLLFVVCFLPSNISQVLIWIRASQLSGNHTGSACDTMKDLNTAFYMSISLTYLSSALDPVVYYFSIPTFKNMCRRAMNLGNADSTTEEANKKTKSRELGSQSMSQL
ncbi:hypothetical protein NHX12_028740 [Muraenolepis orangiensis]|uniref:G-protein coupled receptors family 1 profile domain-containing protein n=1 Tax=Muraenolepis orangiensis TaxID=630683 RepID=A0A9Q0IMD5_9TELE|nr:hypothetical protein NHX12_028740 [Muraenolepis orangiensis]